MRRTNGEKCKYITNVYRWVRILNKKMLIFFKETSPKANIIYDLEECLINGGFYEENSLEEIRFRKRNLSLLEENISVVDIKLRHSSDNLTTSTFDQSSITQPNLNYRIEIEHPYQQKIVFIGENMLKTIEFYKMITQYNEY